MAGRPNKNQMAGQRGGERRNQYCNGGDDMCLPRYNAANVGTLWKTKKKWERRMNWSIRRKRNRS
jgi:hypothetical protein